MGEATDALDRLPLEVLLALHEAAASPGPVGEERARKRAEDAGYYLVVMGDRRSPPVPLAMEEAPDDVDAIELSFGA